MTILGAKIEVREDQEPSTTLALDIKVRPF